MKNFALISLLLLLGATVAFAASAIDGGWAGQIGTGDAAQTIMMSLTVDGTRLSGSMLGSGGGDEMAIQNGTFDGTKLEFQAANGSNASSVTINCEGTYSAGAIALVCRGTTPDDTRVFTVTPTK